jgi:glycine cleavage system H protein
MKIPQELFYTKTHEWARREAKDTVVGITAQLPKVGRAVKQGEAVAVIESVKAAFDIYAPVAGTITRVNDPVTKSPQLVNQDCYGAGWLFALTPASASEFTSLFTAEGYEKQLQAGAH